jgi:hypothetical protein
MILSKKATSGTIAAKRLGVSLIDGRLPAKVEPARAKFVGGLRKRGHSNASLVTSWPIELTNARSR